jgi:hypothetical protein
MRRPVPFRRWLPLGRKARRSHPDFWVPVATGIGPGTAWPLDTNRGRVRRKARCGGDLELFPVLP